ncbi:recombinase family protein [Oscillospiraceae bacterium PP1C4]
MQKVAAYCRVSTDKDDQVNSLESQKKYFREYIERNPFWELTEVYVDEGITGTSTKKRRSFNKMIKDAENHSFNLILTKEISRFARNTLDSIFFTRKLKDLGIGVIFMNDNINTLEPDAELRLTIMSSIAQEESRKTSDRVKWGQKRRMEQGVVFGRSMLGYHVKDGKLSIIEADAQIVRLIFHKFVNEGKGTHVIARELREAGIQTHSARREWSNTAILRILRNEKYMGDLIQKKTFTPSYLSHEKKCNQGEEELVVLHEHHQPIIDRDLFERAQQELAHRRPDEEQRSRHSNRYCFSGKIKCGYCGNSFVSRTKRRKDGSSYKAWRCYEAAKNGQSHLDPQGNRVGCDGRQINHEDLLLIMSQVIKNLPIDKESMISQLTKIIKPVLKLAQEDNSLGKLQAKVQQLTQKKQNLIDLFLNLEISKADFHLMNARYEADIAALEQEKLRCVNQAELQKNQPAALDYMIRMIEGMVTGEIQSEPFYRNILDKIVVYDRSHMDIYLDLVPFKFSCLFTDVSNPQGNR